MSSSVHEYSAPEANGQSRSPSRLTLLGARREGQRPLGCLHDQFRHRRSNSSRFIYRWIGSRIRHPIRSFGIASQKISSAKTLAEMSNVG